MSHWSARESRSTSKGRKRARLVDSAAEGRRNQGAQPARPQTYNERQLDSIILQKTAIPEFKRKSSLSATSTGIMHMPNFTPWKLEIRIERGENAHSSKNMIQGAVFTLSQFHVRSAFRSALLSLLFYLVRKFVKVAHVKAGRKFSGIRWLAGT